MNNVPESTGKTNRRKKSLDHWFI